MKRMKTLKILSGLVVMGICTIIQVSASYIDGIYVGNNAQVYQNKQGFFAGLNLFKVLKGNTPDKTFVEKYAKAFSKLIDNHLSTNKMGGEKEMLLMTVSALSKDIVSKVEGTATSTTNTSSTNTKNNTQQNTYNANYLNDVNNNKDDAYYGNNQSNVEEENNEFEGFGGSYQSNQKKPNQNKNTGNKSSYSKDDLWKDMYSIKGNEGYIKSIWKPGKSKDDYAYHIEAAKLVRGIINDGDSDTQKIEKIHTFLKDKYYSNVGADPVGNLEEYTSRATNLGADKTRGFALPFNGWQGVCQGYNDMYGEMLQIAGVKGTIQKQTGYAPTGVAHMHLLVNGQVTDALGKGSAFNSKIFDLNGEIRNNFNYN